MKKTRADVVENRLPEAGRAELAALVAANAPLKDIVALFASYGHTIPPKTASAAHHRLTAAQQRLANRAATIKAMRDVAARHGVTLTEAALDTATNAVGDLLDAQIAPDTEEGQQLLLKALTGLTGARSVEVSAERVGVAKGALVVAERKLALLEAKEAKAKAIVADTKLTAAEQAARLREIFGK
jgi:hypothetical protein